VKALENLLNKVKPTFEEGGKLEKFYPVYDALETFAFVPDHTTSKGAHIRDAIDMKRTMFIVILALVPALLFGIYNTGLQHYAALGIDASFMEMALFGLGKVLPLIIVSYGVGLGVEFIFCIIKGHSIQEVSSFRECLFRLSCLWMCRSGWWPLQRLLPCLLLKKFLAVPV